MSEPIKNLTTPDEVVHAFLIKDSRHAMRIFARKCNFSQPCVSQHIHRRRKNIKVLQAMADHLGCGVYGVMPVDVKNRPESAKEGREE